MLSANEIQLLKSENELLQLQLQDVNYMIRVREEELEILRQKAQQTIELKSRLDTNLYELEQMQNHIGELQQKTEGAKKREAGLEEEMMQSISIEKEFYDIRDQFSSAKA